MNLNQLTVTQSLAGLKKGDFTSTQLTQACLNRIKITNKKINSILTLNSKAISQAKKADKLIQQKNNFKKYPLLGVPFVIKDNFLTKDIRTTASARLLDNHIAQYSSTVYQKLINAGSILLGKTNMDAWAHGSSTETSDYGSTKNPWNLDHLPGGSSGGSAAAVSADQCIFAIGSETAGSIRQPAAWCGVTGFKPTYGRVSRYGVIAMASSTDSPGPLTKTVEDAALITSVIAGFDSNDFTTSPLSVDINLTRKLPNNLKGKKFALPKEYMSKEMKSESKEIIYKAIEKIKSLGGIVDEISLLDPKYSIAVYTVIQRSEVASNLSRYDGIRYGYPRNKFSYQAKNRSILGTYSLSTFDRNQESNYQKAQKVRTLIIDDIRKTFEKYDFIVGPTSPGPALKAGESFKNPMFGELEDRLLEASSIAGLTGVSLPCGFVDGLPIGLQIVGNQFEEQKVFEVAKIYQDATNWHLQKPNL